MPLLFDRLPALERVPWLRLAELPTPVERLALDGASFWIKRDDLSSRVYGGNKVRKLEFILAKAKALGATRLITAGAAGSHHALATALYGRQLSLDATLILFPQPLTTHVRDVLLMDCALGAELRFVARMTSVPAGITLARLVHLRERTFVVAPGGSDATGTLGYVNGALELAQQVDSGECDAPELIVAAAGTLGTVAGLAIGLELIGWPTRIAAVRITSKLVANDRALAALIRATCTLLRDAGVSVDAARALGRVDFVHDQLGLGYGKTTDAAEKATELFSQAGITLDTSYTAKAAAAVLASSPASTSVLYWHTLSGVMPPITPAQPEHLPQPFRRYLQQLEPQ